MDGRKILYLKIAATVALLLILVLRVDLPGVFRSIARFGASVWITNLVLYFVAWAVAAVKWKTLLPGESVKALLRLSFIGQYYSTVLPGQLAGEVVKAYRLGRGRHDAEQIAASVVIDRITGFLGLLGVALGGMLASRSTIDRRIGWTLLVFAAGLLIGLFCLKIPRGFRLLGSVARRFGRVGAQSLRLLEAWKRYLDQPAILLLSTVLGAGFQLLAVWINVRFARELGIPIQFADWCWLFGLISIATMLPFTIGGIGLREGSFVGALALFGVAAEQALAVSLAVFGLLLAGALLGAVLDWTGSGRSAVATAA